MILALLLAAHAYAADVALVFEKSGQETARYTASELAKKVKPQKIAFFDPHHGKNKSYRAFPIKAVMEAVYGRGWEKTDLTEVSLVAADGYASLSKTAKLAEDGGFLAFEDLDVPGWEPIGRKKANPGPFYLVWTGESQSTANEYPWPWQLATVNLIRFEDRFPEVVPGGTARTSPAWRGYMTFRGQCLRCHSINMQGGKIGPDLNAPQSVTSYRTKEWVKSYVKAPSKYRYTEMPDHPHLTDENLEELWAYFLVKAKQGEKSWEGK